MNTIEEVFSENIRRLRGDRTQAEIAERARIPLRSYQKAEGLQLPRPDNRSAIAKALGVPETELFLDPDLAAKAPPVSARIELLELASDLDEERAAKALKAVKMLLEAEERMEKRKDSEGNKRESQG